MKAQAISRFSGVFTQPLEVKNLAAAVFCVRDGTMPAPPLFIPTRAHFLSCRVARTRVLPRYARSESTEKCAVVETRAVFSPTL